MGGVGGGCVGGGGGGGGEGGGVCQVYAVCNLTVIGPTCPRESFMDGGRGGL